MIWAELLHLTGNMWTDRTADCYKTRLAKDSAFSPKLVFDRGTWDRAVSRMAEAGMNMVLIDVGDGVVYDSHPEIAIEGSWSKAELRAELARLRKMGLEPIPKLNFSSRHDSWLKDYHRMLSTEEYYRVCADLIAEVGEIFDRPRFIHLGMDEEGPSNDEAFVVVRQGALWEHDLHFLMDCARKGGMRPWIWWYGAHVEDEDAFFRRLPKDVIVSSAYYYPGGVTDENERMKAMRRLAELGLDIIPCGSNWACDENMRETVAWSAASLPQERVPGFLMASWMVTLPRYRHQILRSVDAMESAREMYEARDAEERPCVALWFVKDGQKSVDRTNYPEDRLILWPDDQLVLDFGIARAGHPVLELRSSWQNVPATVTVRGANRLDGKRAVPEGEAVTYVVEEGDHRFVSEKALPAARYLVITTDKKVFITGTATATGSRFRRGGGKEDKDHE